MEPTPGAVTAERFAQGMTFDAYVTFTGSPENLRREGSSTPRRDFSGFLREAHGRARLSDAQVGAVRWLAAQPGGPAKVLVLSEEWSSDCRRDVPMLARLAEAGGLELRIFTRDGDRMARAPQADPAAQPNADLVNAFLNDKNGQTWQSIPVAAFYTRDMRYLYHYVEFPRIYEKDRVVGAIRAPRPGEAREQAAERGQKDFFALQASPFFTIWACAGIDEILTKLHERLVVGSVV